MNGPEGPDEEAGATPPDDAPPAQGGAYVPPDGGPGGPEEGYSLQAFSRATGLPVDFLRQAGVTQTHVSGRKALRVACRAEDGGPASVLFQTDHGEQGSAGGHEGAGGRYQWRRGDRPTPFGREQIRRGRDQGRVLIVRHLADALVLRRAGLPALALLDADRALDALTGPLRGLPAVFLPAAEAATPAVRAWVERAGIAGTVWLFEPPPGGLAAAYREAQGETPPRATEREAAAGTPQAEVFTQALDAALAGATPWGHLAAALHAREADRAWGLCGALAASPDILGLFAEELRRAGVAGDLSPAQALFLCLTSRLLDPPVSLALKGPSAGGKSFLLRSTLPFFPDGAYHEASALTPRALAYTDEPLAHRMLVVAELDGLRGEGTEYLLRTLLSEGRIAYDATVMEGERRVTRRRVVEGPTGLIVTTTRLHLHPENETRLLSLEVSDAPEQTRAVLAAQARGAQGAVPAIPPGLAGWRALQSWLEHGERAVVVPFAARLAALAPAGGAVRLRRDFPRVLQLVKAHALLHRAGRVRDAAGRVVATPGDYAAVYGLVAAALSVSSGAQPSAETRETVEAAGRLCAAGRAVTVGSLARELGLDRASAERRASLAVEGGWLAGRSGPGGPLTLGEELPAPLDVLPRPERLWDGA